MMKLKKRNPLVLSVLVALCETLSLNVVYYVPSEEDAFNAISNLLTSFYIDGLDPWSRSMNYPLMILGKLCNNFQSFGFVAVILLFGLAFAHYQLMKRIDKTPVSVYICAALFGIIQTMGLSIHRTLRLDFCFAGFYQLLLFIIVSSGYFGLFVLVFKLIEYLKSLYSEKLREKNMVADDSEYSFSKRMLGGSNRKELWISFGIICFIYLIWIAVYFPGSVDWDSHWAIEQLFAGHPNQHFPVLTTWLHAGTLLIGRAMGSDNIGVFIYVFFQMLIMGYAFSKVIRFEIIMGMTKAVRYITLAFYTIVPIWGIYAQSQIKNTLFTAVFVIFVCDFWELIVFDTKEFNKSLFIRFGLAAIFTSLLLNQGLYVVLISLFIWAVIEFFGKKKKECLILFAAVFVLVEAFNLFVTYGVGITKIDPDSPGELYSLPSVVTAYYIKEHRDILSVEEIATIEKVYTCDVDTLALGHLRGLSDGTKSYWNPDSSLKDKIDYFSLWIKEGFKNPKTYLEGIFIQSYGYYVLAPTDRIENMGKESYFDYWMSYSDHDYQNEYAVESYGIRDLFSAFTHFFEQNTLTGWITNQGLATWVILSLMIMISGKRKRKGSMYVIVCLLLYVLTCIASPVNGMLRYYLPVLGSMPLVWTMVFTADSEAECGED